MAATLAAAALAAVATAPAALAIAGGEWVGTTTEDTGGQVMTSVNFDVLAHLHRINAFGGLIGIACGTTDPSAPKEIPKSIGLAGGGYPVEARISTTHRFHFRFSQDGGTVHGKGEFLDHHHAAGTISYVQGTTDNPSSYCSSGVVHWHASWRG